MNDGVREKPYEAHKQELPPQYGDVMPEPRRRSIGGILVGLAVGAALIAAVVIAGRGIADVVGGLNVAPEDITAPDVPSGQELTITIPAGSSARDIAELLTERAVVRSTLDFEVAVRTREAGDQLKAGEYDLTTGMTPNTVIDILVAGPDVATFRLTLREGLRIDEVLAELARQSEFESDEFAAALISGEVVSAFVADGADTLQAWEGALFPDTYEFFADVEPAEILQRLSDELERKVGSLNWTALREGDRDFSIYDGLIMASLVEAETRVPEDRPQVASVLFNRLEIGQALQIDATVLYAMGERGVGLTFDDLETPSPYNTYLAPGLPPTPIGTIRLASMEAVASPAETDFIYYVLTSEDGSHSFTADYDQFLDWKNQAQEDGIFP